MHIYQVTPTVAAWNAQDQDGPTVAGWYCRDAGGNFGPFSEYQEAAQFVEATERDDRLERRHERSLRAGV